MATDCTFSPDSERQTVIELGGISVVVDGRTIVDGVDWSVRAGEHWAVIGPNGGGKSTLVGVAGLQRHPTKGTVRVLDHELGRVDIRSLRARIGTSSAGLANQMRASLTANDIVRCGLHGALEPWWHRYEPADWDRADKMLADVGLDGYGERSFGTLSSGERQRVLLARTLMPNPALILLDEPTAGLDFEGRESMVAALDSMALAPGPPSVLVTHHVEDIPSSTTHLLAIRAGKVLTSGLIESTLSAELLTELYGIAVTLHRNHNRWGATARPIG